MSPATANLVRARAAARCEDCLLPEAASMLGHVVDHVIARQHRGSSEPSNLALCCGDCNLAKGPNIAGRDPLDESLHPLFNPRTQAWRDHFDWSDGQIVGLTPVGRTTVEVLSMNRPDRTLRRRLASQFPPS